MKIFIPHPSHSEDVLTSGSGASISGHNHARALSKICEVYHPAETAEDYAESTYGIAPEFETIESSVNWFERLSFDALIMFEPNLDELAFYRHVCPAPIIIRLSCCYGHNRSFLNDVLACYSLLRPWDALAPKSEWAAREIGELVYDLSYVRPISNGVDLELFKPLDKLAARKEIAEITGDRRFLQMPVVGFCSRFEPGKGAYPFLRVADRNPNVLFPVIGQQFGPVTHPPNVVFLGPHSHDRMPLFYNALDVLCVLSVYSYESCPSAVLEGMACGLPVVATRFSGAPEILGDCGELIDVERFNDEPLNVSAYVDPELVSNSIRSLIEGKTVRMEWGTRARKRAESFSWERVGRDHITLIDDLKEKRDRVTPPVPLSLHFTQRQEGSNGISGVARAYNHFAGEPGPLPRIPFMGQEIDCTEGLAIYLSQVMFPNEVEAVIRGLIDKEGNARGVLDKCRKIEEMFTAP